MGPLSGKTSSEARGLNDKERRLLRHLPGIEQRFVREYHLKGKTQAEIAWKYGVSQAAVSYRLKSASKRLAFLREFPILGADEISGLLRAARFSPTDVRILTVLYKTTCQLKTADRFGVSQGRIRYRLHKAVKTLEALGRDDLKDVLTGLRMIRDRTGTIHSFAHWSKM